MMTERCYVKAHSLAEIHDLIHRYEQIGWRKAGTLMYTHDGFDKTGWEIAMEREAETLDLSVPPGLTALGWVGVSIVVAILSAGIVAMCIKLVGHLL